MSKPGKMRADQALVDRGLVESRAKAQALIMAGKVFSGERRIEKAGQPVTEETALEKLAPTECPDCNEAVESLG